MATTGEAIASRSDLFQLKPQFIVVQNGWNPRQDFGDINALAEDIKENGIISPIRVKKVKDEFILVDGERRLRATMLLISQGIIIEKIPAVIERKGISEIDALINAFSANKGLPFNPFEEAATFKRLKAYGMEVKNIAERVAHMSIPWVYARLRLCDASPELQNKYHSGELNIQEIINILSKTEGVIQDQEDMAQEKTEQKKRKVRVVPNKVKTLWERYKTRTVEEQNIVADVLSTIYGEETFDNLNSLPLEEDEDENALKAGA